MEDFKYDIQNELDKEIAKELEEKKLEDTIKLIKKEILNYIEKRKYMSQYILSNRKDALDEYRDDEDKIIEYFDHERFVNEEAFKTIDRRLKELLILVNSPYYGKVNFLEENSTLEESIYIGRFGMTPEGEYEPVVVDWRAPISALFYSGKNGENSYKAPMGNIEAYINSKRQFIIKKAKLIGMFDSTVDVKDEILQMVLSSNSSEKLKDIIMTIQEEQDNLIRQPRNKTIIVNGVAGSGKTTIALHRVAYLLYNHRDTLQDKMLILGPNSIFMEYISTVLPSLGEVGVKQRTFKDFAMDILGIDEIMPFKDYLEAVMHEDKDFIKEILRKTSPEYINYLDNEIEKLDKYYFNIKPVVFREKIIIDIDEIEKMFSSYYKDMPLFRRSKKIRRIIFSKLRDARDEVIREIEKEHKHLLESMSEEELKLHRNNVEYNRILKIRGVIRDILNSKAELNWIYNPELLELYNTINGNKQLTQDDLAPILYLKHKLEGIKLIEEIKHVVIDEAQDYSEIQFRVIKEITKCISLTIVGDENQRLLPLEGKLPMLSLNNIFNEMDIEVFNLEKSYRSTREIMEYANQYISNKKIVPLVRSGEPIISKSLLNVDAAVQYLKDLVFNLQEKSYESIAIVFRDEENLNTIAQYMKEVSYIKVIDREEIFYKGGVVLIPSYLAKGLEFDVVIMVDFSEKLEQQKELKDKVKYVMCTRALHELYDININQ
jgi:Superfamily I DNA and RNA helicases